MENMSQSTELSGQDTPHEEVSFEQKLVPHDLSQENEEFIDSLNENVKKLIKEAQDNALDVEIEDKFIQEYSDLCDKEILPEAISTKDEQKLKTMEERVKKAIAMVPTLSEFSLLLKNIGGLSDEQIRSMVEHENAHANIAEINNKTTDFHGYGVIFFKDGKIIVSAQPVVVSERKEGSDKIEFIKDSIEQLKAPDEYGHNISADDEREIRKLSEIIKQYTQED